MKGTPSKGKDMSTNSECQIIEYQPGQWYYVLEDYNAPKNAWDWRENACAYGPFGLADEAMKHLHDNHANPGAHWNIPHDEVEEDDEVLQKLIADAPRNMKSCGEDYE